MGDSFSPAYRPFSRGPKYLPMEVLGPEYYSHTASCHDICVLGPSGFSYCRTLDMRHDKGGELSLNAEPQQIQIFFAPTSQAPTDSDEDQMGLHSGA